MLLLLPFLSPFSAMEASSLVPQSLHEEEDELGSCVSSSFDGESSSSIDSSSSEFMDDATSSSPASTSNDEDQVVEGPLFEMNDLMADLPFKRGLSKHFQGKSQSFTSLSNVMSLEDLAKPQRPCKKKLKACKIFGMGLDQRRKAQYSPNGFSRTISKKTTKSSLTSSLMAKRQGFMASRTVLPIRSSNVSSQTLLFA